jgi:DNA polymerase III sliding clamp (beta) subunit (PCNA family)
LKVLLKKAEFVETLKKAYPTVADSETVQLLNCFIFKDGLLSTYSGEAGLVTLCDLGGMDFAVDADMFYRVINSLFDDIELEMGDGSILITSGENQTSLPTLPTKGFPDLLPKQYSKFTDAPDLRKAMEKVRFTVGTNAMQPVLLGLALSGSYAYSSDGLRISRCRFNGTAESYVSITAKSVDHIIKLGQPDFTFLSAGIFGALWRDTKTTYICNILSYRFPIDVIDNLFAKKGNRIARFPDKLLDTLDRVRVVSELKDPQVVIQNDKGKLLVRSGVSNKSAKESLTWDYQEPFTFAASPKLLRDVLEVTKNVDLTDVVDGKSEKLRFFDDEIGFDHMLGLVHYAKG